MKKFLIRNKINDRYWGIIAGGEGWVEDIDRAILKNKNEWRMFFLEFPNLINSENICYYRRD